MTIYTFFLIKLKLLVCLSVHNITFNGLLESSLYYDSGYQSEVFQTVVHHCIAGATPLVKNAPITYSLPCFIYQSWGWFIVDDHYVKALKQFTGQ